MRRPTFEVTLMLLTVELLLVAACVIGTITVFNHAAARVTAVLSQ
jgi:hypothetical protein